jgi:hypothetical protein
MTMLVFTARATGAGLIAAHFRPLPYYRLRLFSITLCLLLRFCQGGHLTVLVVNLLYAGHASLLFKG